MLSKTRITVDLKRRSMISLFFDSHELKREERFFCWPLECSSCLSQANCNIILDKEWKNSSSQNLTSMNMSIVFNSLWSLDVSRRKRILRSSLICRPNHVKELLSLSDVGSSNDRHEREGEGVLLLLVWSEFLDQIGIATMPPIEEGSSDFVDLYYQWIYKPRQDDEGTAKKSLQFLLSLTIQSVSLTSLYRFLIQHWLI